MDEQSMNRTRPAIFLDRDGTLIEDRHYLSDPSQVELLDGCIEGLQQLSSKGYLLVMVTNQSAIARGLATREQVDAVNEELVRQLALFDVLLDGIYLCPHHPDDQCECRKPNAGMIEQATQKLPIDNSKSWVIGDKCSDVLLGQNIGALTVLISSRETNAEQLPGSCEANAKVTGFREATEFITSHPTLA
jgi:histidinol-phosphate phosphatase family protein